MSHLPQDLTDAQWAMLDALIPEPKRRKDGRAAELGAIGETYSTASCSYFAWAPAIGALNAVASPAPNAGRQ